MQIFLNICVSSVVFAFVSLSFSIEYYESKVFNISKAAFLTISAYLTYTLYITMKFSFFAAIMIAITICIFLGIVISFLIIEKLRKKNTKHLMIFLSTMGIYVILQNIISMVWGDDMKSLRIGDINVGHEVWGAYITDIQIITIVVSASCLVLSLLFLKYTKVGQRIRAVSANSELANVQGINSDRVILWATGIGSGMAAIAGILVGFDTGLTPTMGFNLLLYGIVAMIIGGVGSTKGLIGGAFLLAAAQHLTAYYIDSKWMNAITYIILIAFLIWRPLGFSGQRMKKIEI